MISLALTARDNSYKGNTISLNIKSLLSINTIAILVTTPIVSNLEDTYANLYLLLDKNVMKVKESNDIQRYLFKRDIIDRISKDHKYILFWYLRLVFPSSYVGCNMSTLSSNLLYGESNTLLRRFSELINILQMDKILSLRDKKIFIFMLLDKHMVKCSNITVIIRRVPN